MTRTRGSLWNALCLLVVGVSLVQVAALLWLIWARTPHVPWWDEWETVTLVHKFDHGGLGVADIWGFHNEHRIVIPRLIDLSLIELTHWNRQLEMTFDLGLALGGFSLLMWCLRATLHSAAALLGLAAPCSLLVLSLAQYDNFLWPFQITFIATVCAVVGTIWALGTRPVGWRGLVYAIACALIASLSSFAGLLVWGAFLPTLWIMGYRRVRFFLAWVVVAIAVIVPYIHNFPKGTGTAHSLAGALRYALAYLGTPVGSLGIISHTPHVLRAQIFGTVSLAVTGGNLLVTWLLERSLRRSAIWIGLGLFALGCAAVTSLGRGPASGIAQALTPRYQAFSALWWVAAIVIAYVAITAFLGAASRAEPGRWTRVLRGGAGTDALLLAVVVGSLVAVNAAGFADGRHWMDLQRQHEDCVRYYDAAPDGCLSLYYLPAQVRTGAGYLQEDHLAVFESDPPVRLDALPKRAEQTKSFIDSVGPVVVARAHAEPISILQGAPVTITGWAADAPARAPASMVLISVDDTLHLPALYGLDRADVAAALKTPAYGKTGFSAILPPDRLTLGRHTISIAIVARDGKSYFAPPQRVEIEVRALLDLPRQPLMTRSAFGLPDGRAVAQRDGVPLAVPAGRDLALDGWAVDSALAAPAGGVAIAIDGQHVIRADYGVARPDVAEALGIPADVPCGFNVTIPADALTPGIHTLTIVIIAADAQSYDEPPERLIVEARS